jgi:hypothetical protein
MLLKNVPIGQVQTLIMTRHCPLLSLNLKTRPGMEMFLSICTA